MLCVRAEDALAAAAAVAAASDKMRASVTLGGSIQRAMQRMGRGGRRSGGDACPTPPPPPEQEQERPARLAAGSGEASVSASCSADDSSNGGGKREGAWRGGMRRYRSQLEQEVRNLQRQLQEEIDMHLALTDAITHDAELILKSSTKLPNKAQELVDSISSLEITISKLETDLSDLRYQLCHVRTERLLVESNPECLLSTPSTSKCTGDEHTSALRDFKLEEYESVQSMEEYLYPELEERHDVEKESENREKMSTSGQLEEHQDVSLNIFLEKHQDEEMQEPSSTEKDGKEYLGIDALSFREPDPKKHSMNGNMCNNPNQLSGEMIHL
uniref:Ternary complex factor MIP1 leucine-zipper domain-containing protein n=1 Tax=Triticum urartu TaxID=4572 RepID=A0A8R7V5I8_TRIUA